MIRILLAIVPAALIIAVSLPFIVSPVHAGECVMVKASWYGIESCKPQKRCQTATGLAFNGKQWLVAHKTLRMGTKLRLTYNGRSVVVPVGDRGPYIKGRTLDLSRVVAVRLGTIGAGVAKVCMERL